MKSTEGAYRDGAVNGSGEAGQSGQSLVPATLITSPFLLVLRLGERKGVERMIEVCIAASECVWCASYERSCDSAIASVVMVQSLT